MSDPLLYYSISTTPLPLQVNSPNASIVIAASNPGFYSDKADQNYVAPTVLVFDFGSLLTGDASSIAAAAVYTPKNGAPVSWGAPSRTGAQFTFNAPNGTKVFPGDSLTFSFTKIAVAGQVASVGMNLTETASSPGDPSYPGGYYPAQPSQPRFTTRQIGIFPVNFSIDSLVASPTTVGPGMPAQLSWSASQQASTSFALVYAVNGAVQTVTQHADGTPLKATDTYPSSANDPGLVLSINRTTTFSLQATYVNAGTRVTAERQTTVSVPDPTITTFTATPSSGLLVGSAVQMAWQTLAADYVTIMPPLDGVNPVVSNSGGATIYPLQYNRYVLTASGRGLNVRQSVVLFPMPQGWSVPTTNAPWQTTIQPLLMATSDALWIMPASPQFSPMGQGTNPLYSSPDGTTWIMVTPNLNVPVRSGGASLSDPTNNKVWVMGGTGSGGALNDVWSSTDGRTWTSVTNSAAWQARSNFGCVYFGGKYWIMGGLDRNGNPLNDVWSSTNGSSWTQASAPAWSARSGFGLAVFQGQMWLVGGKTAGGQATRDVWSSSDGINWTLQPAGGGHHGGSSVQARAGYQLFGSTNYLYAFAGAADASGGNPALFYQMDSDGEWLLSSAPPGLPATAMMFGSTAYNGGLWLAGGQQLNSTGNGVWVFRPASA